MGDEMTPPGFKVMNSMGGTEKADEGGALSVSDPLPPRLQTWAAQPSLDSLSFNAAGSSLIIFSSHFPLCSPVWNEQNFLVSTGLFFGVCMWGGGVVVQILLRCALGDL